MIFDWPLELVFKDEIKEWKSPMWEITGREAFQKLGTEAIRGTFGDDFWVKRWACDYIKVKDKQGCLERWQPTPVKRALSTTARPT